MKKMLKNLIKNIFANEYVQSTLAWFFHFYIWLVYKTSKIIIKGDQQKVLNSLNNSGLVILAWHGRIILTPVLLQRIFETSGKDIFVLASTHRDGQIAGNVMTTFGIKTIAGSSIDPNKGSKKNKKSFSSIKGIIKALSEKNICVIAADAPRGPIFSFNTKVTELVKKTNSGITCTSISCKRKKIFNTWDKFELPFPFNKIIIQYSDLVQLDENTDIEQINSELEKELKKSTKLNDKELTENK